MKEEVQKIALAICTLNRSSDLLATLRGVEKQRCAFPWEILVVDNGSEDRSLEAAQEFARNSSLPMRVISEPRRGISFARNRALAMATADILVFIDDDVDCDPRLLECHVRSFEDPDVLATGGRILPLLPQNTPKWIRTAVDQEVGGPTTRYDFGEAVTEIRKDSGIGLPLSCNLGLRRGVALKAGGFRTDLGWTATGRRLGGEDTDLLLRLRGLGGRILYLPEARVIHRVQAERVTKAYYRTWHVGYGRASVIRRGRPGPVAAIAKIMEQLFRIVRYSVPPSLFFDSKAKRLGKRYQALGRILQLAGL
jgi:glycosyltransferase involved in cell wall biosynthesis